MLAQTKCIKKDLAVANEIQDKIAYSQNLLMNDLSKITVICNFNTIYSDRKLMYSFMIFMFL